VIGQGFAPGSNTDWALVALTAINGYANGKGIASNKA
jgi:hypothetical protein